MSNPCSGENKSLILNLVQSIVDRYKNFDVVSSQVIPNEVQDSTGDNLEKPGKIHNKDT